MEQQSVPWVPSAHIRKTVLIVSETCSLLPFLLCILSNWRNTVFPWLAVCCGDAPICSPGDSWRYKEIQTQNTATFRENILWGNGIDYSWDILRRLNYGSWNILPFHFVLYMNRNERCFHTPNPSWEKKRAELNTCSSLTIIYSIDIQQKYFLITYVQNV